MIAINSKKNHMLNDFSILIRIRSFDGSMLFVDVVNEWLVTLKKQVHNDLLKIASNRHAKRYI
jgi:hypothetical protein